MSTTTLTDQQWRLGVAITLLLALLLSLSRMSDLPADGHEVFVLETTQEMHAHGNWVVPWFNDQLRLRKPPLNYWLTGMVAGLGNSLTQAGEWQVREWHGRLISALAMLGLVWLTLVMGQHHYGRETALLAALILVASSGFFGYAHDARPDPLYALLCTLGYAAWLQSQDHPDRQYLLTLGMWLAYALATLSKGPQLPAMLLLAGLIEARLRSGGWRLALAQIRPLPGLVLFLLVSLPWWWLLKLQVDTSQLARSQLSGSLLTIDWHQLLDPYYLYRPWQMLLPWALLLPLALVGGWRSRPLAPFTRSLLLLTLVPALILGLGPQQRWFYMLPVLIPMVLLLARGLTCFLTDRSSWCAAITLVTILLALAGYAYALWDIAMGVQTAGWGLYAGACGIVVVALLWLYRRHHRQPPLWEWYRGILLIGLALLGLSGTRVLWSADRFHNRDIGIMAGTMVARSTPLIAWRLNPNVFVYYSQRFIRELWDPQTLRRTLAGHTQGIALLSPAGQVAALQRDWRVDVLSPMPADPKFATLLRLTPRE